MKISIITATYNSSKTIAQTIESILRQNYHDFEHIIVDGASSDTTLEIVDSYKEQYNGRLKIVSEKDNGLYDAMNKGIAMASGEIIGILNSDDILCCENALSLIEKAFTGQNCDAVYADLLFMDSETLSKPVRKWNSKKGNYKLGWHPAHPTLYLKRSVYENLGTFDTSFKIAADYDFMLRLMKSGAIMCYIPETIIYMRAGGVSTNGLAGYIENLRESYTVLKKNKICFPVMVCVFRICKTLGQFLKKSF